MSIHQTGEKNGQWKGGRSVASNGYVLIRVGKDHPLADVRGYAYEHRLVASDVLGRLVLPTEQVHHRNENKTDNRPENLEVVATIAEHRVRHRKRGLNRRLPGEGNPDVCCECGCGTAFPKYDECGRPRKYISGHNQNLGELSEMVLYYLQYIPLPGNTWSISSTLGESKPRVSTSLARLERRGLVRRDGEDWRACG